MLPGDLTGGELMRSFLGLACTVLLSAVSAAEGQAPAIKASPELHAARAAALQYAKDLPSGHSMVTSNPEIYFNAPPTAVEQALAGARKEWKEAGDKLKAMEMPVSNLKGFDITFALESMRARSESEIAAAGDVLTAMEAMQAARMSGDCSTFMRQETALEEARRRMGGMWRSTSATDLQNFLGSFAGGGAAKSAIAAGSTEIGSRR